VDGGNSKTVALAAKEDGTIVSYGRGGNSDLYNAGSEAAAFAALDVAVSEALKNAELAVRDIGAAGLSMAGADWPEDSDLIEEAVKNRGFQGHVTVVNDGLGALRAGSPDGTGVAVVCGTGAATGAHGTNGRSWHSSWWQEPQGSGHLAEKALRAVYRAELGIDPPTVLTRRVLEIFGAETVEEVLHARTGRDRSSPNHRGQLTRALLQKADAGDVVALQIVQGHGAALGDYASAAAREVALEGKSFWLVLAGGVLRNRSSLLADALADRVRERSPQVRPIMSRFEPVVGALLLAFDALKVPTDELLVNRIEATLPDPSIFQT
jgi:N-acetylglucosamine kinase-like BadF-type ATPase